MPEPPGLRPSGYNGLPAATSLSDSRQVRRRAETATAFR